MLDGLNSPFSPVYEFEGFIMVKDGAIFDNQKKNKELKGQDSCVDSKFLHDLQGEFSDRKMKVFVNFVLSTSICVVFSAPQYSETNQLEDTNNTELEAEKQPEVPRHTEVVLNGVNEIPESETTTFENPKAETTTEAIETTIQPSIITKIYTTLTTPILKFLRAPKVSLVMTNIGTCIVNGAMEIVSFYFPAPLIPLIASAAGLIIPFEPVVMLREKMPVTSYRRAFKTAVNGFLRTFDRYKYEEDDPYMTGKFYRRFMGDSKEGNDVKGVQDSL